MRTLTFKKSNFFDYNKETKTFLVSEKIAGFDTSYKIINLKTGKGKTFDFVKSTGPEFDPNTSWIYTSEDGLTLEVYNNAEITEARKKLYLKSKLKN